VLAWETRVEPIEIWVACNEVDRAFAFVKHVKSRQYCPALANLMDLD